jgi:hypothetical protein
MNLPDLTIWLFTCYEAARGRIFSAQIEREAVCPLFRDHSAPRGRAPRPAAGRSDAVTKLARCAALALGALLTSAVSATALCVTPVEEGRWINIDPDTRGLPRIELTFVCQDQVLNGEPYPPGPPWYIHAWGRCHPQDCDWGEVGAQQLATDHIYGVFEQGFARKHVWAKMSQYLPDHLWVYLYVDFADPARPDYDAQYWFRRESATTVNCGRNGSHSLFVANFENDTVGLPPAACAALVYGPPGACLEASGGGGTFEVIDSAALGSKALHLQRSGQATIVDAVVGDIGQGPYSTGTYYVNFRAHGAIVPQYLISGPVVSVTSVAGRAVTYVKLFDDLYHRRQGDAFVDLSGAYDPTAAHSVHVELDLDARRFSMCVNDQVLVADASLFDSDFDDLHAVRFYLPATITEAFPAEYVVDDIRITRE